MGTFVVGLVSETSRGFIVVINIASIGQACGSLSFITGKTPVSSVNRNQLQRVFYYRNERLSRLAELFHSLKVIAG